MPDMKEPCNLCGHRYGVHTNGRVGPCVKCDCLAFTDAPPTPTAEELAEASDDLKELLKELQGTD